MSTIYRTNSWNGYGKQNYNWNEYRLEDNQVTKVHCNRHKFFDGDENNWEETERVDAKWFVDDPNMPEWLKNYL